MTSDKQRKTVGDHFALQRGTTYKSSLLDQPGPLLLGLASIQRNGGFRTDALRTYGGESPTKLLVQPGQLYLSLKDVTQSADLLGAVAKLPLGYPEGRLTQDTVKLEPSSDDVPVDYLYWLLQTPQYRSYCRARATGTTNLGLAREDFLAFPAPEPTQEQQAIVRILGALDDKIELNRRMNETLEETAQAVFKSWFVDFDPVRAKAEGREPNGVDVNAAGRLPAESSGVEGNELPEGWRARPLSDVAHFLNGVASQKYPPESREESLPVIKISELRQGFTDSSGRASSTIDQKYIVNDGDVIFSWSGSLELVLWGQGRGVLNQHLFKVTSQEFPKWFYYFWTKQHLLNFRRIAADKATTMGHIQRHHLTEAQVVIPPPDLLDHAHEIIAPMLDRLSSNQLETRTLIELRNTLLPKLISGELRVPEAEREVEEVL